MTQETVPREWWDELREYLNEWKREHNLSGARVYLADKDLEEKKQHDNMIRRLHTERILEEMRRIEKGEK